MVIDTEKGGSASIKNGLPRQVEAAIAIAVTSHGPVIFRQKRMALKRRPFTMYKLRAISLS